MGWFDWFFDMLSWLGLYNKSGKILFLGLDNAGKTTLLHKLKSDKMAQYEPTVHPNVEELTMGKLSFTTIDLGGHKLARRLWKDYFTPDVSAVVFIVDAADRNRFVEAAEALSDVISTEELNKTPLLILGNKIDKVGAVSDLELVRELGIAGLTTGKNNTTKDVRPLEIFMCSILNQAGYKEGFEWVSQYIA